MTLAAFIAAAFDDPADDATLLQPSRPPRPSSSANLDSSTLVTQIQLGSIEAVEALFRAEYASLVRYVLRFTDSVDAAEDLAQEALVDVIKQLQAGDHRQLTSVTAFLRTVVRRRAVNALKRDQRTTSLVSEPREGKSRPELHDLQPLPDAHVERAELLHAIRMAFALLPSRARLIATMRWYDDLGRQEIAAELGLSVRTVDAQLYIAAGRIREVMTRFFGDCV